MKTVYEIDPLNDARWPTLVEMHPRSSVFHSKEWLSALSSVYGYMPKAITTCGPNVPLTNGLPFCFVRSLLTGNRVVSLPFSDHCEPLIEDRSDLDELIQSLRQYAEMREWKSVSVRPLSMSLDASTGFVTHLTYTFHRLDLRSSLQELFSNFHKDCVQRKIRRAEREKLQYEDGRSESLLQKFYQLLIMTRRRQYLPPQPLSWFRSLIASLGKCVTIRVACKNGIPVSSILTISHKKSIVYKYGCSNPAFNNLGGTALLFWMTIQEAKECGLEELDMGRSDADNPGLIAFKRHWGASETALHYWSYPLKPGVTRKPWQKRLTDYVVSASPDLVLQAAGSLLYKHIG